MLHIALHFIVPAAIAWLYGAPERLKAFAWMMAAMLIDLDHLLATPIYDPERCSIGFHPLHSLIAIGLYVALFAHERTRWLGLGLLIHIALDAGDCVI